MSCRVGDIRPTSELAFINLSRYTFRYLPENLGKKDIDISTIFALQERYMSIAHASHGTTRPGAGVFGTAVFTFI